MYLHVSYFLPPYSLYDKGGESCFVFRYLFTLSRSLLQYPCPLVHITEYDTVFFRQSLFPNGLTSFRVRSSVFPPKSYV
jgi:hypothetical protein